MLTHVLPEALEAADLRVGDIAGRLTYQGDLSGNNRLLHVVMGDVQAVDLQYAPEFDAYTVPLASAASLEFQGRAVSKQIPVNAYGQRLLLRGLPTTEDALEQKAHELADNDAFIANDNLWEVSFVGLPQWRRLNRALFLAGGGIYDLSNERPGSRRKLTDAELRCDHMARVGESVLNYLLLMPPTLESTDS